MSHQSVPDSSGFVRPLGRQKEGKINKTDEKKKKHKPVCAKPEKLVDDDVNLLKM